MVDGNIQCNLRAMFGFEMGHEYQGGPFPYQGGSKEYNYILSGVGACAAARQVYLQGSSW